MLDTILFDELGLSSQMLNKIKEKGFKNPTFIQSKIIPLFLKGEKDIIGQANTGTGKTASFGIPLLEKLSFKNHTDVKAIILTPTRELAIQVAQEINTFSLDDNLKIITLYGGQSMSLELRELKNRPQIIVGTPGRVKDHLLRKSLRLENIEYFILDEADEMLKVGFREEIEEMLATTPNNKRTLLFSATMPKPIMNIVEKYIGNYEMVSIKTKSTTNALVEQVYFEVRDADKFELLCRNIDSEHGFYGIIFCRTRNDVDNVTERLINGGYSAEKIHGDIDQKVRERILNKFRKGGINILIATDVAARGIDVNDLTHIINYSLPENPEIYTHRIGRTGRAGKSGKAISFVDKNDYKKLVFIEKILNTKLKKEKIPSISDIIEIRQNKLIEDIKKNIGEQDLSTYQDLAKKLLGLGDSELVLETLLRYFYKENLNKENYKEIVECDFSSEFRNSVSYGGGNRRGYSGGRSGGGRGYGRSSSGSGHSRSSSSQEGRGGHSRSRSDRGGEGRYEGKRDAGRDGEKRENRWKNRGFN